MNSRLIRVLLVRMLGVMMLVVFWQTATVAISGTLAPAVVLGIGMVDLVVLFMGVFMTFGKIDKEVETEADKKEWDQNAFTSGFDAGFEEGYEKALEDEEEDKMHTVSEVKIPDRAPDEVGT